MPDYSKGKIYKITSKNYNKIYIGSTCRTLEERFAAHKWGMGSYIKQVKGNRYCSSYLLCEEPDCKIELIKLFPCSSKQELYKEEGKFQKVYKNIIVNEVIIGRTMKEWLKTEKGIKSIKKYNNSEKGKANIKRKRIAINIWRHILVICPICNLELKQRYLKKHIEKHNINN